VSPDASTWNQATSGVTSIFYAGTYVKALNVRSHVKPPCLRSAFISNASKTSLLLSNLLLNELSALQCCSINFVQKFVFVGANMAVVCSANNGASFDVSAVVMLSHAGCSGNIINRCCCCLCVGDCCIHTYDILVLFLLLLLLPLLLFDGDADDVNQVVNPPKDGTADLKGVDAIGTLIVAITKGGNTVCSALQLYRLSSLRSCCFMVLRC